MLRDIEKLIANIDDSSFTEPNFYPREYKEKKGRTLPQYLLTVEAVTLLAMNSTGREAKRWKPSFLAAFWEMERQLAALKEREA